MAASTCTSSTATVTGTDPDFVLTRTVKNRKDGIFLYLKITFGGTATAVTVVCKTICQILSLTDTYNVIQASGAAVSALTYTFSTAGNYKVPLALSQYDDKVIFTITPNTTTGTATIVADIMES